MSELPKGWVATTLGQVVNYADNETVDPAEMSPDTWLLELEDIERDSGKMLHVKTVAEREPKSSKNRFYAGDVLYGKLRPYLNKVTRVERNGLCSSEIIAISPGLLDKDYLFYSMRSPSFIEYVNNVSHGMRMPRLGTQQARSAPFVLPPRDEQTRIAQKANELLAQVDALQTRIDAIPTLLKHFRQSVLAAAVSGQLTEEWRTLIVSSKGEKKPAKWLPSFLSDLGELARGKSKHRPRNDKRLFGDKYPFIQTGEVAKSAGRIKTAKKFYSDFGLAQSRLFPKNTLCITIAANIADTAILDIEACFPDSVVGFVANEEKCRTQFIKYLIDVNKQNLEAFAPATAQKNINLKVLSGLVFPMPSLTEQTEIVRRVEQLFAFADQLEAKVAAAKSRIDHLTQSILAKAFRGELVAQDPNDEPASVLLERIKAQRAAAPTAKRGRKASV